jgi:hypothetical protein
MLEMIIDQGTGMSPNFDGVELDVLQSDSDYIISTLQPGLPASSTIVRIYQKKPFIN